MKKFCAMLSYTELLKRKENKVVSILFNGTQITLFTRTKSKVDLIQGLNSLYTCSGVG